MTVHQPHIIFLGINEAGRRIYDWLINRGENILCLITHKSQLEFVAHLRPELVICCGFRYLVPASILEIPRQGCINIHSAYLPYNRGANPDVWSIVEGTPAGATIHYMDEGLDTGPILVQKQVQVHFKDTAKDLYGKLEHAQFELFTETWDQIKLGKIQAVPQSSQGTFHKVKDFRELCKIDLSRTYTGRELLDRIRALTFPPYKNAYFEVEGVRHYLEVRISCDE